MACKGFLSAPRKIASLRREGAGDCSAKSRTGLSVRGPRRARHRRPPSVHKGGRGAAMFANVLIANRGEIACRIIRTARRLGHAHDRDAHARRPRRALHPARRRGARDRRRRERLSRRRGDHRARAAVGAQCLHPGYGFLCENADFAEAARAPASSSSGRRRRRCARWGSRTRPRR